MIVFLLLSMYTYGAICLVSGWYLRGAYDKEKRTKAKDVVYGFKYYPNEQKGKVEE